jgi:cbb3-type cytochrome oxidase maturation protein
MSVIILLISASLIIALGFLAAFIWSVKDDQYEDDYTPSVRILFDNDIKQTTVNDNNDKNQ